jgi:hypothetical protein
MNCRCGLVAVVLWCLWQSAGALETYAYRFTIEPSFVGFPPPADPRPVCSFVSAKDEVEDVSTWFREKEVPLANGWVVWNRTRRLLVVHATIFEQWRIIDLSGFEQQPQQVRIDLEWFRDVDDFKPPAETRQADTSLVMMTRSGIKADGSVRTADKDLVFTAAAEIEPVFVRGDDSIDVRVAPRWSAGPQSAADSWDFNTGVTIVVDFRCYNAGQRA